MIVILSLLEMKRETRRACKQCEWLSTSFGGRYLCKYLRQGVFKCEEMTMSAFQHIVWAYLGDLNLLFHWERRDAACSVDLSVRFSGQLLFSTRLRAIHYCVWIWLRRRPNRATAINFMLLLLSRRSQARNRKNANSPLPSGEFYAHVRRWIIEMREPGQNTGILQQCAQLKEALSR
jgi:hypothetical protein